MQKISKAWIYKKYGIEYKQGKILCPYGWVNPLLVDGNMKLGKGVWTFSTLPTCGTFKAVVFGQEIEIKGTCACTCEGCYATKGNYNFPSVRNSLATKTFLCMNCLEWVKRAILAQIEADKIGILRIHASGDFYNVEYLNMWKDIVAACPNTAFWTYTKVLAFENAFDGFHNANIVKSIVHGFGFNFGHCDYILTVFRALVRQGKKVFICRCGIDKNQHCTNCHSCLENEIVLFVEHSTDYKAESDPFYNELKAIIESQKGEN